MQEPAASGAQKLGSEQKVNSQVRTSEAAFMFVRVGEGGAWGAGGPGQSLLSTIFFGDSLPAQHAVNFDAICDFVGGRQKAYQPGFNYRLII